MKFTSKKRGFTIIELVIVIAVVAILAAVLIPVFSNLVQQGKDADAKVVVRNLNTGLKMETSKPQTMHDALAAVEKNVGINVAKLNETYTKTGNMIVWDSVNNTFLFGKDGTNFVAAPEVDSSKLSTGTNLWALADSQTTLDKAEYSYYWTGDNQTSLTVKTGFDAGEAEIDAITYQPDSGTAAQSVVIRTASVDTVLTVNAKKDVVNHYGKVNSVNIEAVAASSYHEYGSVVGNITVKDGNVVMEGDSSAQSIVVDADVDKISSGDVVIGVDTSKVTDVTVIVDSNVKAAINEKEGNRIIANEETVIAVDENSVAAIGNINYGTFEEALSAAQKGATITLLKDVNYDGVIDGEKDVVINMNGKSIYTQDRSGSGKYGIIIEHATVAFVGNGYIKSHQNNNRYDVALVYANGSTDDQVTEYTYVKFGAGIKFVTKNNNTNSEKGKEVAENGCFAYAVAADKDKGANGSWNTRGITISYAGEILDGWGTSINGSITNIQSAPTFIFEEGAKVTGIYAAGYANWIINGGLFTEQVEVDAGNIVINGGSFNGNGEKTCNVSNSNSASCTGYALAIVSRNGYAKSVSCVINGGNFNTEIIAVNKTTDASTILTINKIGTNHGVQKYNAVVSVPSNCTVTEYVAK